MRHSGFITIHCLILRQAFRVWVLVSDSETHCLRAEMSGLNTSLYVRPLDNSNAPQACDTIAGCLWSYKHTTQSHCVHFSSECSVHWTGTEEKLWSYMIWWHIVWMCVWMWVHDAFSRPSRIWCRKFSTYSLSLKLWMQPRNLWHRMWGHFAIAVVKHCWSSVMWDTNKLWR